MSAKILVVRFSSIGDIVLTSPVVRCLKKQLPKGTSIQFLTKKRFAQLVEHNPYLDKVHTIEKEVSEVLPDLRKEGFDTIIDLHNNLRTLQIRNGLRSAKSHRFQKLNWQKWLLVNAKIDRMPTVHIVDRYMETASSLGVKNDGQGLDYFLPDSEKVDMETLPESHQKGYVAVVIGARHATKRMPADKLISICRKLEYHIVLLGGPEDEETGHKINAYSGELVWNGCGKLTLHQSASLVQQARAVLTHDTGMMHVAAAFRKRIVSVWGNTVPELGMSPYLPEGEGHSSIMEVKGLRCRPCSKIGFDKCPKKHFNCMNRLDDWDVVEHVRELI